MMHEPIENVRDECLLHCPDCHDSFKWNPRADPIVCPFCGSCRVRSPYGLAAAVMEELFKNGEITVEYLGNGKFLHTVRSRPDVQ